ncbi:hypothetical protein [Saccharopolyspora sp. NPDC002376]
MTTNHPGWLPKRSIAPVYITIALGVLALLYWVYQFIFGADERAAREAQNDLSDQSRTVCTQAPPPTNVRSIMGEAPGRPNGPAGCIWGPEPNNELYLRHGMSTLDEHLDASGYGSTATSPGGKQIFISNSDLYCTASFDDRTGRYFELNLTTNNDPSCSKIGPLAGELADLVTE